jgi:DNA-binding MarR family transcriptional regulator
MGSHTSHSDIRLVLDSLRRIVRALRLFDREAEKSIGLSGAQAFVLEKLRDARGISINELAVRTHTHQSSVSVVVQKLVERKLVRRSASAADGRRLELFLTDRGRKMLVSTPPPAQQHLIAALARLQQPRLRDLAASLTGLVTEIGLEAEPPSLFFEYPARRSAKARRRGKRLTTVKG